MTAAPIASFRVTNPRQLRQAVAPATRAVAEEIRAGAAAGTPRETSHMANAWEVLPGRFPAVFVVSNPSPYGPYVELGTDEHEGHHMLATAAAAARARYCRR